MRALYVGVKVVAHVAMDVGEHALAHAGEDAVEHAAEHEAEDLADHVAEGDLCRLSFAASTLVLTPTGERAIASLKTGDTVTAYDPQTGKASSQTVEATSIHHDANLVDVTLKVTSSASSATSAPGVAAKPVTSAKLATTSRTEVVHTTANHPWLSADHGWLIASFLHVGEPVLRAAGSTAMVVAVKGVPGAADMWDLTVSNLHDFAVGSGAYVVHNKGCDVFERYGSEDEAKAAADSGQLEMKKTPDGRYHKGEKWIADEGAVNPRTLGKRANYRYRMEIETDPGTRDWLKDQGFDYKPNEPGRYGIPWDRLDEFNQRIRNIRISQW